MARDLGKLLDMGEAAPEPTEAKVEPKVEAKPQPKEEPKEDDQAKSRRSALVQASAEDSASSPQTTDSGMSFSDLAIPAAGAASGYAMKRINEATMLPSEVRNAAINLRNTNAHLDKASAIHNANAQELAEATLGHNTVHNNDFVESHIDPADLPEKAPPEPVKLEFSHEGGPGVENYEKKFVPIEFDKNAPSMSNVQGVVIPANEAASIKTKELSPGTRIEKETGLALDPDAQEAQLARKIEQKDAADAKAAADELQTKLAREKAQAKVQPYQDAATKRLNTAQAEFNKSQQLVDELTNRKNVISNNMTSKTSELKPGLSTTAENLASKGSKFSDALDLGGRLLKKVATPALVASIPYEGHQAWEEAQKGNWTEAAKHGIGAAGGLAQLAPAAAAAGLMAPELAAGAAVVGGLAGLGVLGHDIYENRKAILDQAQKVKQWAMGNHQ